MNAVIQSLCDRKSVRASGEFRGGVITVRGLAPSILSPDQDGGWRMGVEQSAILWHYTKKQNAILGKSANKKIANGEELRNCSFVSIC